MHTTTITQNSLFFDGPMVVETSRGSAHRRVPTTRPFGRRPAQALTPRFV